MSSATLRTPSTLGIQIGMEPPIEALARRLMHDGRAVSFRWLAAVILTGMAGSGLIAVTIRAALDGRSSFAEPPELVGGTRRDTGTLEGLARGDRLVRAADIVAEKQSFRAPTTLKAGDKQIVRMRGFTHVATTLALAPTGDATDVPPFNPVKLLAGELNAPDLPADPGPALNDADVSFTTSDIAAADPSTFRAGLSGDEVQAQVAEFARAPAGGRLPLSPQVMLMRTSRAGAAPAAGLGFAGPAGFADVPFASIEVRMVPENVTTAARTDPARDKEAEERLLVFRHGDILEDMLRANGATREQVASILGAFAVRRNEAPVSDGRRLKLFFGRLEDGKPRQIARISVYNDEALETTIALNDNGHYVLVDRPDVPARPDPAADAPEDGSGMRLYDSLYETALKQDIPRPIIDNLVRVFANDVDFQRSVAGGDSFDAFYTDGDDTEGRPELLFASIIVRNETFRYYRFQTPDDGSLDFYDENGRSVRKFLMRSPVPTGQFTSGFGLRFHPILGYTRPHTGVDWAAPIGTPILAAGSGTVLRAHSESGYGNRVEIQHANGYITTYSHMASFARGVADGVRIKQGQVVGYLGQTGLATGPHLHYEVIVNGHFVDPMRVKLARTREIGGRLLGDFQRERERIDSLMASAPNAVAPAAEKHATN